jgi:hypothetical protein
MIAAGSQHFFYGLVEVALFMQRVCHTVTVVDKLAIPRRENSVAGPGGAVTQ